MTEFQKYIQRYLDLITSSDWIQEMKNSGDKTIQLYQYLSEEQGNYAYAPGKWTLKEVLQHIIDSEKIFAYRALRFARKDKTDLAGWDEEFYGQQYDLTNRSISSLVTEFEAVRHSTSLFFENLNTEQLSQTCVANHNEISVETLRRLIIGHNIHHLNIIEERYLTDYQL